MRRERSRQRELGVVSYQFVQAAAGGPLILLVPFDGRLFLARGEESLNQLLDSEGAIDAQLSPDGSHIAFVRADSRRIPQYPIVHQGLEQVASDDDIYLIWSSERTGFRHLSLHDRDGRVIRTLTEGLWMVTGQVTVDEDQRLVYFQGTFDGPL